MADELAALFVTGDRQPSAGTAATSVAGRRHRKTPNRARCQPTYTPA